MFQSMRSLLTSTAGGGFDAGNSHFAVDLFAFNLQQILKLFQKEIDSFVATVAFHQLIHRVDQGVELVVGLLAELTNAAISLLAEQLEVVGSGHTDIHKVSKTLLRLLPKTGKTFVRFLNGGFVFGLHFQDELHGLFNVYAGILPR